MRPLDRRRPVHLILRSTRARGRLSLLTKRNRTFIYQLVFSKAKNFGVRIDGFANVGNHIHMKIRFETREGFQKFLISITGRIARFVTGACKGNPFGKFWDGLAFTKVITVWKQEVLLDRYITGNGIEGEMGRYSREMFLSSS